MEKVIKYSVLRYVPELHREEFINIGLVFHSPADEYIDIKFTTNFSRVKTFDDEVDLEFLKLVLEGMKDDFSSSTISGPNEKELSDLNFLEKSTAFYVNQLQFSSIMTMISPDIESDFVDLFKTYVYFDAKKNSRINNDKVKSLLSRVFSSNQKHFNYKKDVSINIDSEDINMDFVIPVKSTESNEKVVLNSLSFDYSKSREKNVLLLAKEWHWNINKIYEMKNSNQLTNEYLNHNSELKFTTIVLSSKNSTSIKNALEILSDVSNIIQVASEIEVIAAAENIVANYQLK